MSPHIPKKESTNKAGCTRQLQKGIKCFCSHTLVYALSLNEESESTTFHRAAVRFSCRCGWEGQLSDLTRLISGQGWAAFHVRPAGSDCQDPSLEWLAV